MMNQQGKRVAYALERKLEAVRPIQCGQGQPLTARVGKSFRNTFLGLLFFTVFSLSDFYFKGLGRIFDYLFLISLLLFVVYYGINFSFKYLYSSFSLLAIVSFWVLFGVANGFILASSAILVGICLVYPIFYRFALLVGPQSIDGFLKATIAINLIILLLQAFMYYQWGSYLDLHLLTGSIESRGLNEGLSYFRPSGLFQEPNAYCTLMFCLLSLRVLCFKSSSKIDFCGLFSMVLTQSLWGYGATLLILLLMIKFRKFVIIFVSALVLVFSFAHFFNISIDDLADSSITVTRIIKIERDPSMQARYGSAFTMNNDELLFLGHGIDTTNFQTFSANSFNFLLYSFGVIGTILLFLWFVWFQKAPFEYVLVIFFLFTTFPLFSYMYFWCWLGLLMGFKKTNVMNSNKIFSCQV